MISKNELKSIRSLKNKKYRESEKRFLVEGTKNVLELLKSDFRVEKILGTEEFQKDYSTTLDKTKFSLVTKKELKSVSTLATNESCLAVVHQKKFTLSDIDKSKTIFVLDGINDPGNLGTIIRSVDWFGFDQIVCSKGSVEFYNPKVILSSMGSFTRVKVIHSNLNAFLDDCPSLKVGADMNGQNLKQWVINEPIIVVMGSESHGISPEVKTGLDEVISISGSGSAESLNVGVATGIIAAKIAGSV